MPINEPPHIHQLIICANVFVRKDGKYLMIRRSQQKKYAAGLLAPIGGKVLDGESPLDTATREALEEAGIEFKNWRLEAVITEVQPYKNEPFNWLIFHFSADYAKGTIKNTEEGELILLNQEEILDSKLFPSHREIMENILNPGDGTVFARFEYDAGTEINQSTKEIKKLQR